MQVPISRPDQLEPGLRSMRVWNATICWSDGKSPFPPECDELVCFVCYHF